MSTFSHLPADFVGTPSVPIRRKSRHTAGFYALPFVSAPGDLTDTPCWVIPASGGHQGEYATGEAMGLIFLKVMREDESEFKPHWLGRIADSLATRLQREHGDSRDSLRGQSAGFFNLLGRRLTASVQAQDPELDALLEQDLLMRANAGLGFDAQAYRNSLAADIQKN